MLSDVTTNVIRDDAVTDDVRESSNARSFADDIRAVESNDADDQSYDEY